MVVLGWMLSIWKLRVGAEAYYLEQVARGLDDYYTGAGESAGEWLGTGTAALGLAGLVTADDLHAVLAGLAPGTGLSPNGDQLRTWKGRVPGFDLTFSAPKSVSVLYALGDPIVRAEVVDAHQRPSTDALGWFEREACFVRRGSNNRMIAGASAGCRRMRATGFVAAAFRHRTSRAGDPQLHSHVLVANIARGPDGRWTALDGQALYRSARAAGALYQSVLRDQLSRRLGVEWRPVRNDLADIAGVPDRVLELFSKRRREIEDELERQGASGLEAGNAAALATRSAKTVVDASTLDARWREEAASVRYDSADIDAAARLGSCRSAVWCSISPRAACWSRCPTRARGTGRGAGVDRRVRVADRQSSVGPRWGGDDGIRCSPKWPPNCVVVGRCGWSSNSRMPCWHDPIWSPFPPNPAPTPLGSNTSSRPDDCWRSSATSSHGSHRK